MKLIRRGTFETNSSSTHSIVIPRNCDSYGDNDCIVFKPDSYGWSFSEEEFKDYLWTAILSLDGNSHSVSDWEDRIKTVLSPYYEHIVFETPEESGFGSMYYIDHGNELSDLLDTLWEDDELLLNGIMGGTVFTGNDNVYSYEDPYKETVAEYEEDPDYYVYEKWN